MKKILLTAFICLYTLTTIFAQIFTLPYSDDFESGAPGWISYYSSPVNTIWELGSPAFGATNSTHSGNSCWDINLDTNYSNSAICYLISPEFDLTNVTGLEISFWQNIYTENGWDGFRLEYATDTITGWTVIGSQQSVGMMNWYTDNQLNSSGLPAWEGSSNGWIQSSIIIPNFGGGANVWFRFVFTSDASVVSDGVSIDDFSITQTNHNIVSGTAYLDVNSDYIIDAGDVPLPNMIINSTPPSGYYFHPTDVNGNYSFLVDSGIPTTFTLIPNLYSTVTPSNYVITFNGSNQSNTGNDFLITYIPGVIDADINISSTPVRPGLNHTKIIQYTNNGTTFVSGTISLMFDPSYSLLSSSEPFTTIAPNTIEFLYTNLLPGENRFIYCDFVADSTLPLASITSASVIIYPITGDTNIVNNYDTVYNTTINSFDPNNKLVDPEGDLPLQQVSAGMDLNYTINFQNTGTAEAINIHIYDMLDANLDLSTFEVTGFSHSLSSWNIASNRQLSFNFNNIFLPDSNTNEGLSHGFVTYKISPYTSLTAGTQINNFAAIVFDNNLPVITNNVTSTVVIPTGLQQVKSDEIILYPNPNTGEFYLNAGSDFTTYKIYNITGQIVNSGAITTPGKSQLISSGELPAGMYLVQLNSNTKNKSSIMIIE